jgi:colicin import membrane protein
LKKPREVTRRCAMRSQCISITGIRARFIHQDRLRSHSPVARKLKTYQTSIGFFDIAVAAPSMKAALAAWGSNSNLFHQGFAREVTDPQVIAATLKKPGVVLRRPVGSHKPFQEHADLPTDLPAAASRRKSEKPRRAAKKTASHNIDDAAARKAALAFEKKQQQRERQRRRQQAAQAGKHERRQLKVAKAEAAIEQARQEHQAKLKTIEDERARLERLEEQEGTRWETVKMRLETAVKRARR